MSDIEEIKKKLTSKKKEEKIDWKKGLSSGSTLLNLACTNKPHVAFLPGKYYWLVGDSTVGKAQPLDAKVLTPDGWVRMGDLTIGDPLICPTGGKSEVIAIHPQGKKEVYRVSLSDGSSTLCCADHLWEVTNGNDLRRNTNRVRSTLQIKAALMKGENQYLPAINPVSFNCTSKLPIHPYLMGCLLGNGHFGDRTVRLSTLDQELLSYVTPLFPESIRFSPKDKSLVYKKGNKNPLLETIRSLGLGGCRASKKFIPEIYLRASIEDRIELLRGLMDTDGCVDIRGVMEYSTISPKLAKGIVELVNSLGGICPVSIKKKPTFTYKNEKRTGQPAYRLYVRFPKWSSIIPFRLNRKIERLRNNIKGGRKKIVSVEKEGKEVCQCITVSSPTRLYITDDYIVTHNSWISLSCLAEATLNPHYDNYRFIYDNTEDGALMDISKFFGEEVECRLEAPSYDKDKSPIYSSTVQEFYFHVDDAIDQGTPFIYILDSMDAIDSQEDQDKFVEIKEAYKKGKEAKGSYGVSKAKINSSAMRRTRNGLEKTDSILIVVSQTRDNIGFGFDPKTVAGGQALKFYATLQMWGSPRGKIEKVVNGKKRQIGITSQIHIRKNRITGQESKVDLNIYYSHGIDDLGNMVNYLIEEGHWEKAKGAKKMEFPEFSFSGSEDKFIEHLEETKQEHKLIELVSSVWNDIVDKCSIKRKKRYE